MLGHTSTGTGIYIPNFDFLQPLMKLSMFKGRKNLEPRAIDGFGYGVLKAEPQH